MKLNSLLFLYSIGAFTQLFFQVSECIHLSSYSLSSNGTISHEQKYQEIKKYLTKNATDNSTELNEEVSFSLSDYHI